MEMHWLDKCWIKIRHIARHPWHSLVSLLSAIGGLIFLLGRFLRRAGALAMAATTTAVEYFIVGMDQGLHLRNSSTRPIGISGHDFSNHLPPDQSS